jgi:hypothetical protein
MAGILGWPKYWDGRNIEMAESYTDESDNVQNYINCHCKKSRKD